MFLALLTGCSGGVPAPAGAPVPDPAGAAAELQRETTPEVPRQASFNWDLNEAGSRVRGRGIARYEAPERLRIDLFGPRGETYLAAALVGDSFRIPEAAAGRITLPSPALLWGALGVVRPPSGAELTSVTTARDTVAARYTLPGGELFDFQASRTPAGLRLFRVERLGQNGVLESVRLTYDDSGAPREARYRNWAEYRELALEVETISDASSFPEEIWIPGAAR